MNSIMLPGPELTVGVENCNGLPLTYEITQQPRFSMDSHLILVSLPLVSLPKIGYSNTKFSYKQLLYAQGSKHAVAVVHTTEEIELLKALLETQGCPTTKIFRPYDAKEPDFLMFVSEWNLIHINYIQNIYYYSFRLRG